jgi:hypothetical protein
MRERTGIPGRLVFGLAMVALGALWTLDEMGGLDASVYTSWWPVLPLAWGLMVVFGVGTSRRPLLGGIWLIVGVVGLLDKLGWNGPSVWALWPLILVYVGIVVTIRALRSGEAPATPESGESRFTSFAFLGSSERKVASQAFRQGDVTAVLGGSIVDLRSARLENGRGVLDVFAFWGGIEVVVPEGWVVVGESTVILGGFDDSTRPVPDPNAPTLTVRGFIFMGGVQVKHEPTGRVVIRGSERGGVGVVIGKGDPDRPRGRRVIIGGIASDLRTGGRIRKEIRFGPGGITIRRGDFDDPEAGPEKPAPGAPPPPTEPE